jgi:predicted nucleic acid-binding protein
MFVLDASVAAAWFFPDEANECTDSVLEQLRDGGGIVPPLWSLEIANILLVAERRRRLTEAQSAQAVQFLQNLPIAVLGGGAIGTIMSLGRQQALTAYDASYLDLAMREGRPLATQDTKLQVAAEQVGVPVLGALHPR